MNWLFFDLDATLVDTKALLDAGGPEPIVGTPEHSAWLTYVTNPSVLRDAGHVTTVLYLIKELETSLMSAFATQIRFITNRRESMRDLTSAWLYKRGLYHTLLMRPEDEISRAGDFKASVIKKLALTGDTVTIIDDDPDGSIERVCKENKWTHLKVTSY